MLVATYSLPILSQLPFALVKAPLEHSVGAFAGYNIRLDIAAARKLFTSGIPLTVLPLDSTQLKLDEARRAAIFSADTPLTNATTTLYQQWTYSTNNPTPTLFDVFAIEQALDPATCPTADDVDCG